MIMARTITSPGVEINERDLSLRPIIPTGTSVLIPGFAHQGPTDEVFQITSLSEFETVYGLPTNAAERYFHKTAKAVFNSNARVLATRLPYGTGAGLGVGVEYTALFYPAYQTTGVHSSDGTSALGLAQWSDGLANATLSGSGYPGLSAANGFVLGKPTLVKLSKTEYEDLHSANFSWSLTAQANSTFTNTKSTWGKAGMIIVNKAKTAINDKYEGYYVAVTDNSQANPATDFTSIISHVSVTENSEDLTLTVPDSRRNFYLQGTPTSQEGSVSEVLEQIPSFDISTDEFHDTITVGLFKLRTSVFSPDSLKLDFSLVEAHMGSLDSYRKLQNPNGGAPQSFFIGDIEDASANLEIHVNPHISTTSGPWQSLAGSVNPQKHVRVLTTQAITDGASVTLSAGFGMSDVEANHLTSSMTKGDVLVPLGTFQPSNPTNQIIGGVPTKLNRVFRSIENRELVDIDISVEAGLGTIYAGSEDEQANGNGLETFDDERYVDIGTQSTNTGLFQLRETLDSTHNGYTIQQNYRSVWNEFNNFAEFKRKDHLFIADAPRWIFVQGNNQKVLNDKTRTFSQFVYWPLKHIYGANSSSYATVYANWGRSYDGSVDRQVWCPFSGYAAATMANSDQTYAPWWAPAGFTRGRFGGVTDLAVLPTQKHRDQLYKISMNPVHQFPNEGMVIWGQKTLLKKPSAFDRINVRRLFLYLEKLVRQSMKFYVFEPNTVLTRNAVKNTLTPPFEFVKNNEGMYDYLIICDERNNTPDRIDQNELVVDIYIKPVRAAEFILVNFYATRTDQDFSELTY
jgi:hypothetical protein